MTDQLREAAKAAMEWLRSCPTRHYSDRLHASKLATTLRAALEAQPHVGSSAKSDADRASDMLMECADFFAATLAKADPRAWDHLLTYAPGADQAPVTGGVKKVPDGQTPLDERLRHPLLDVFNEGAAARESGKSSPYHGHSLEHCLHAAGWVQKDLSLALAAARMAPTGGAILPVEPSEEAIEATYGVFLSVTVDRARRDSLRRAYAIDNAKSQDALSAARAQGRIEGLEEAARVLEGGHFLYDDAPDARLAKQAAAAIRAIKDAAT